MENFSVTVHRDLGLERLSTSAIEAMHKPGQTCTEARGYNHGYNAFERLV